MNSFSSLPIFVAVVECGSFSQAAKQLHLTKSAVSKRINQLEEILGLRLLHRTTRKLSLTEAGQRYYQHASQAVAMAQLGADAVSELQGKPQGTLKITVPMSFGVRYIAPLISEFMQHNPGIAINLQLDDQIIDLIDGGYDLAIRIGELDNSNLIAKRLAPCRSVLCASPQYLQEKGTPHKPADLLDHNCLRYSYFRGGSEWSFHFQNDTLKVLPKGNIVMNNSEGLRQAVLGHAGVAQIPTFIIAKDIAEGKVCPLMPEYTLPEHAIYAVFPERQYLPLKVRSFIDFIHAKIDANQPMWDRKIQESASAAI